MIIYDRLSLIALAAEHPGWYATSCSFGKIVVGAHLACEVEDAWPPEMYEDGLEIVEEFSHTCVSCGRYERPETGGDDGA